MPKYGEIQLPTSWKLAVVLLLRSDFDPGGGDNDDGVASEDGGDLGSQKECSPRYLHRWTALGCPWEPLSDIYCVWFCHVLLTMVSQSPESEVQKHGAQSLTCLLGVSQSLIRSVLWNRHKHPRMEIRSDTKQTTGSGVIWASVVRGVGGSGGGALSLREGCACLPIT